MMIVTRLVAAACVAGWIGCAPAPETHWLGTPDRLAPGVDFYRNNDASLVANAGPIAVFLVRVDPAEARVASVLSNGRVLDAEVVSDIARRHNAVVAVNGGFFNRSNGEPTGLLKVDGELVSDSSLARGVVIVHAPPGGPTALVFDRLAAKMSMRFSDGTGDVTIPIDGVDTTRERGKLMMYTPGYHPDTDTAPTGTEWVLEGNPLRVRDVRVGFGRTPIPAGGVVLSFGGVRLPPELVALKPGVEVTLSIGWRSAFGLPDETLQQSRHIINGAGLLRRNGTALKDWKDEGLQGEGFTHARHPRTLIGRDREGTIWLAAIDGRQPDYSIGMTFEDLQRLGDRLELSDALNLDGGGSTTMVIRGQVVNRPSDPTGARPVADAIIVTPR
jgi:hypothetical protein